MRKMIVVALMLAVFTAPSYASSSIKAEKGKDNSPAVEALVEEGASVKEVVEHPSKAKTAEHPSDVKTAEHPAGTKTNNDPLQDKPLDHPAH